MGRGSCLQAAPLLLCADVWGHSTAPSSITSQESLSLLLIIHVQSSYIPYYFFYSSGAKHLAGLALVSNAAFRTCCTAQCHKSTYAPYKRPPAGCGGCCSRLGLQSFKGQMQAFPCSAPERGEKRKTATKLVKKPLKPHIYCLYRSLYKNL